MPERREGAPRLIEWTGERCVPWSPDIPVIYEHYHRYLWARSLASGRRVLDLGSGEGFGSALLADVARSVLGVDVAADAVAHARANYVAENLEYREASATDLAGIPDDAVDLVVAFEVIEHVADQAAVLAEVDRVLAPGGVLLVSTPDRDAYGAGDGPANPYHEHELSLPEFRELVGSRFAHARAFSQHIMEGSRIEALEGEGGDARSFQIERAGDEWRVAEAPPLLYMLIVAGREELPAVPAESTLSDFGLSFLRAHEREAILARADVADAEKRVVETREQAIRQINVSERRGAAAEARVDETLAELQEVRQHLQQATEHGYATPEQQREIGDLRRARDEAVREVDRLARLMDDRRRAFDLEREDQRAQLAERDTALILRDGDVAALERRLARVEQSVTWRVFQSVRYRVLRLLGGEGSLPARSLGSGLRALGRAYSRGDAAPAPAPVEPVAAAPAAPAPAPEPTLVFPRWEQPVVSIVVPVHSGADVTHQCLSSILHASGPVPYEVIVVDDEADEETKAMLARVDGIRVVVNETNLNFLKSVNRGAAEARGRHILLLNNDTEPQIGWLQPLIDRVEGDPRTGVAVSRLIWLGGMLQEAGGIVWQDGTAYNYGRGGDGGDPQYAFARPVDYGSAAALLIRADLWREIGGFDERFSPGYWEDVDLCFEARAHGFEVMYEPRSLVIHHEGGSMGTDESSGGKRHQVLNQPKFVEKWKHELERQVPDPSLDRAELASDRRRGPTVLVVDHAVPQADRDAGSLRMFHLLKSLAEMDCRVTFIADNFDPIAPYTEQLSGLGVEMYVGAVDVPARIAALGDRLDLAILSRPYVAPRYMHLVRRLAPRALVAYDTVDLHFVRERRRSEHDGDASSKVSDAFRHLELAMAEAADVTLTVSADEQRLLEELTSKPALVVPLANEVWTAVPDRERRAGVLFVGGFAHEPNVDAARYLAEEVMPLLWEELGAVTLTIVGSSPPPVVEQLASERVEVIGWVEDLDPLLGEAMVSAAPVRYGAGMKGKVTQAMAAGLPVVTTTLGAEGLDVVDGEDLLIGDDTASFAARIVELHRDPQRWETLSRRGRDVILRVCSPEAQRVTLRALLDEATAASAPAAVDAHERD